MSEGRNRISYLENLQQRADALQSEFAQLEERVRSGSAEAKMKYADLKRSVAERRAEFLKRVREAGDQGDSAWTELKSGVEGAWNELKDATQRAQGEFK